MIRILIIEDEAVAVRRLENFLRESEHNTNVVEVLDSIQDAVRFLQDQSGIDLIFLDIHLADGSSFEIFKQIKITKPIIFITAYDAYAVQAFKQLSVDYLLKPLKKEELELSIKKYLSHFKTDPKSYEILTQTDKSDYYIIEVGQHIRTVDKKEVAYYFSASKITYLVTFDGKKYPLDYSLEQLEQHLGEQYFRINRQYIIHRDSISQMLKHTKSRIKVVVKGMTEPTVISTEKTPAFKEWLAG